jgi:hypothetical protein
VPALNGVADNGDFQRILGKVGMSATPDGLRDAFFFKHVRRDFPIHSLIRFSPVSSGVVFAELAKLGNAAVNRHWFDIRCLAICYAVPFLAGYACALRYVIGRAASLSAAAVGAASCALLLLNPYFVSMLNSFFEEAAFIALLPLLAFYPLARQQGAVNHREAVALAALIVAISATKVQNGFMLALLLPLWWALPALRDRLRIVLPAALVGLLMLPLHVERVQGLPNAFDRVFYGVGLVQRSAATDLGLGRFTDHIGTGYFHAPRNTMSAADEKDIRDHASVARVVLYLLGHPGVTFRLLVETTHRLAGLPLAHVPYLAYSETGGTNGIPAMFDRITTAVLYGVTLAGILIGLLRRAIARLEAGWLLAASSLYLCATIVVVLGEGFNEFARHMVCANDMLSCMAVVACVVALRPGTTVIHPANAGG